MSRLAHRIMASVMKRRPALGFRIRDIRNHVITQDVEFLRLYQQIYEGHFALLTLRELYNLYVLAKLASTIPGDFAEVGVYKGGSAWLVSHVKGEKPFHLFDTFEGLPEVDASRDTHHRKADFAETSLASVQTRLAPFHQIRLYAGFFPASIRGHESDLSRFAFVHLDVDLYQSTLDGLRFFWPRMSPGGLLISHDYAAATCPGVRQAFDEFFADTGERPIPLWDTQALVIKPHEGASAVQ
jgi:O-methyltransferase